ncbi:hypothetical protein FA13DRAFT_1007138 [Coprinellus micaceus]|uniref:Uncharacterized protein n=1 Tax=Coprinellus micaceus TaxID=71717 RepID=A0A4Y7SXU2_COPMI|nr:hypothetical protein FA13DRAFT_1007138 [Coprinellus micaceus]
MVVQSVNFGIRIWSLGMIKNVSGDSVNDFGTTLCRAAVCLGATPHVNRVVRGLEMMASLLFQIMILIADLLLVIRCTVIVSDKRWVALLPGTPYLPSFASAILGLAAIPRDFPVSSNDPLPDGNKGMQLPMSTTGYITSVLSTPSST